MKLFLQLIVLVTVTLINIGDGAPAKKSSRQDVVVPAVIPAVVTAAPVITLVNPSTPSVVANTPELVPAVVDPNPTTAPPATGSTIKPTTPKPDDEDDSSEEEDEDADADADEGQDDENNETDSDDEDDHDHEDHDEGDHGGPAAKQIYLPGYITNHGELLVPLDAVQRSTGERVQYEVIEDPTYPAYAQFVNANSQESDSSSSVIPEQQQQQQVVVNGGGSSLGGIAGDILAQPGPPPAQVQSSEPSEEEDSKTQILVVDDNANVHSLQTEQGQEQEDVVENQKRTLWLGGNVQNHQFGFHY